MGWEYTGLPGPGDVLRATGLTTLSEEEERAMQEEMDLTTGTPPAIGPGGGVVAGSRLSQLTSLVRNTSAARAAAGGVAFLGTRRQPTGDSGSPSEWVDVAIEGATETGADVAQNPDVQRFVDDLREGTLPWWLAPAVAILLVTIVVTAIAWFVRPFVAAFTG